MFYSSNLKKINQIKHCFFSRKNGNSLGIYKSLNCGIGSKDKKEIVEKNLCAVAKKLDVKREKLVLRNQTHSNRVSILNNENEKLRVNADAILTEKVNLALGVLTADCAPILIYEIKKEIIGCIHAGWKGAFKGIIENTIRKFKKLNSKNNIYAAIGPCIGNKSYEVDLSFYKKFLLKSKKNSIYFINKKKNKKLFDLRKYVNDKLIKLNVITDNINRDTYRERSNFFSYRRSRKLNQNDYGRCISVITMTKFSQN